MTVPASYSRLTGRLAALLVLALPAAAAGAQESPSLPFTAGQKALNVAVGESFGIGGLFFRSPSSAWQVEGSAELARSETEQPGPFGTSETETTTIETQLRAGLRSMRALGESTLAYRTVGLVAGLARQSGETVNVDVETTAWNAGVFLDLGGQYLFSPRFGLGIEAGVALRYTSMSGEVGDAEVDGSGFSLGTTAARLTGTLYF